MKPNNQGGIKFDGEKPDWSLFDLSLLGEVAQVLTMGAKKYATDNWKKVEKDRYLAACLRHMAAYQSGEARDKESGVSHLAHAMCCLHFLQWHEKQEKHDRY